MHCFEVVYNLLEQTTIKSIFSGQLSCYNWKFSCFLNDLKLPHLQTSNDLALQFYEKAGFSVTGTVPGYYKNIEPADAHILEKEL